MTNQVTTRWPEVRAGFVSMFPLWLGSAPFGIAYAVSALAAGLTPAQTLVMSLVVFAGAAQFTAVSLFAAAASPLTIIITTLIVNARHLLLSASLAQHVQSSTTWLRCGLGAQLTDESYAVGVRAFVDGKGSPAYQFGANLSIYVVWAASGLLGILLGSAIDGLDAYGLELIFPLTFIGLLVPLLQNRTNRTVAIVAGALALAGALWLPGRWYILLAGIGASGLGAWMSKPAYTAQPSAD